MKTTTVKSLALVAIAALIGFGVLSAGYDDPNVEFSGSSDSETAESEEVSTPVPEPTIDPGLTAAASVRVLVANATGVEGLAGSVSNTLEIDSGYTMLPATNATEGTNGATTAIYYSTGSEIAARGVAEALGLDPNGVLPIPTLAPVADATGANVLVVAGDDLAPT